MREMVGGTAVHHMARQLQPGCSTLLVPTLSPRTLLERTLLGLTVPAIRIGIGDCFPWASPRVAVCGIEDGTACTSNTHAVPSGR